MELFKAEIAAISPDFAYDKSELSMELLTAFEHPLSKCMDIIINMDDITEIHDHIQDYYPVDSIQKLSLFRGLKDIYPQSMTDSWFVTVMFDATFKPGGEAAAYDFIEYLKSNVAIVTEILSTYSNLITEVKYLNQLETIISLPNKNDIVSYANEIPQLFGQGKALINAYARFRYERILSFQT